MSVPRPYRYYEFVMAAFVTILICSNLIGPAKIAHLQLPVVGDVIFGAGILFFPISYVFGDVLTEVYGYARSRRVIWAGFGALAFAAFMSAVVVALPPAPGWTNQSAYEIAFGSTWRIALASMLAYFVGEFLWPHAYKLWGPPLQMFQADTYQAVLFGDLVSALIGGAAVAFVGTFRR